jgi:hypothetical protein
VFLSMAMFVLVVAPILAGLVGPVSSFRMTRLPDPAPSDSAENMVLG